MTRRQPADPAPGPLEGYSARFDDLLDTLAGRQAFRRYLEGLLLPTERNKTLTALANTEPLVGAQRKEAQGLQWFLSESSWSPEEINRRRVQIMLEDPRTAPTAGGALVVDETGDRKDGKATAHVGKQYLGGIGKIDNGVVSVSSLWVDERVYYPLEVEPYTPAHHFEGGKNDPGFRTKPHIAMDLVGWVEGVAQSAYWNGPDDPGEWVKLERRFRDGHTEAWWALEAECRAFSVEKDRRLVVASTDPTTLPSRTSWYLETNLPTAGSQRADHVDLEAANVAEVVRLYALRNWIEQSYKQVKNALGWAH